MLTALVGFYTVQLADERDRAQLQAEKASKVSELLTGVLTSVDPYRTPGTSEPTIRNLLDAGAARIAQRPRRSAGVAGRDVHRDRPHLRAPGHARARRCRCWNRRWRSAAARSGSQSARVAQSLNDLGVLQRELGNLAAAEPLLRESLATRRQVLGNEHQDVAVTLVELARAAEGSRPQPPKAEAPTREALAIRQKVFGDEHRETATSKNELGLLLWEHGDLAGAETMFRENIATSERLLGRDHPNVGASKGSLGNLLAAKGDATGAEALLRENVRVRSLVFGEAHSEYAMSLPSLAGALEVQGRLAEAQALLEQAMAIAAPQLGTDHPRIISTSLDLARVRIARGQGAATETDLRHALEIRQRMYPAGDWRIAQAQSLLAAALVAQKKYAEAEPLMVAADQALKPVPGRQARERAANRERLAALPEQRR